MNTKDGGDIAEAFIAVFLMKVGYYVLKPWGDNYRYDLVVIHPDSDEQFRVQCKSGRIKGGAIIFNTTSSNVNKRTGLIHYRGQVEYFGVYCPDNKKVYLVPVESMPIGKGYLRVESSKNNQTKNINWASDYEISS